MRCFTWEPVASFTEEFEEGGGKEGVGEFEGIAPGAAQSVRFLQSYRDVSLLVWNLQFDEFSYNKVSELMAEFVRLCENHTGPEKP